MLLRNEKSGQEINSPLSNVEAAQRFAELYAGRDSWLWFWIHKCVLEEGDRKADDAIQFIGDSFLVAIGCGLKRPMIRLHHKGHRFKLYLSQRGTICIKTGRLAVTEWAPDGTPNKWSTEPDGNEVYMGCLLRGKFLPVQLRHQTETEKEFLAKLFADPVPFMVQCSKDLGRCCYCPQPLSDPVSKRLGYGRTCAMRWGLPWHKDQSYVEKAPSFAKLYRADCNAPQAFCQAIRENPHDEAPWKMFSDWLTEHGLPGLSVPEGTVVVPRNDG